MRIVIDTNVLVSAAITPYGPASRILELVNDGRLVLAVSPYIFHEVRYVLARVGFEESRIKETVQALEDVAEMVTPKLTLDVIKADPSDNRILECAVAAKAEVLITGDLKHIRPLRNFQGITILTPTEFLNQYFPRP